jgi:hypothetical protein
LYSIILATASAPGAASAAAVSYPLRITTIMKRIHISFIIDARSTLAGPLKPTLAVL